MSLINFRQLHIRVFEGLLNALHVARARAHELLARAGEVAQFLDRRGRDEAAADQPQRQEVADPGRIVLVTLAPRNVPDVHGVGEHQGHVVFKHMPHRLPVDAGRFHRHVRDAMRREPVREFEQPSGRRRDRVMFVGDRRARRDAHTGDDILRVDIQAGTARIQDFHQPPPLVERHERGVPGCGI
jgi:hypothetical protein